MSSSAHPNIRLPRSFEVALPDKVNRIEILKVFLRDENVESGFFGMSETSPVTKIAAATERYSGSDLEELCKAAAYGPIRDFLAAEQRARMESNASAVKQQPGKQKFGAATNVIDVNRLDCDESEFEICFEDAGIGSQYRGDGPAAMPHIYKRAIMYTDFANVLAKSNTSAEAAASYRYAESERKLERDQRGRTRGNDGITVPGSGATPEELMVRFLFH
jgi:SpoVK/Ycf46/Vps4 family AAA+-type ATPase